MPDYPRARHDYICDKCSEIIPKGRTYVTRKTKVGNIIQRYHRDCFTLKRQKRREFVPVDYKRRGL